jgi:DNA-binding SARP family transcriptional activator/pimeloyl-ACP methyl ester carboxylesterase
VQFRLLGGLEVEKDGKLLPLRGRKERVLLACLLLNANRVVARDTLIDALWGERPPETAEHALDVYVSRLRKTLDPCSGKALLPRIPGGYLFRVDPEDIDLCRFERLVTEGQRELAAGSAASAGEKLRTALALYRGKPLPELTFEPFALPEIRYVEELGIAAAEARVEADLALGRHAELVAELESLVATNPVRERLRMQLMLALYRSGRQAEALHVYQDARRVLVGELAIEPSNDLRRLHQAILRHDPRLDVSSVLSSNGRALPETRYARNGDVSIAYQVTGAGPFDVVYVPPFVTNVELIWQIPTWAALLWRLSSFCRLIRFDKRGTGMSDRVPVADAETRVDDIRAVMDAAGSSRAALIGASDGGPLSLLFTTRYVERVWALVLWGTTPRPREAPDYPAGYSEQELEAELEESVRMWTEPGCAERLATELGAADPHALASMWRQSASPGAVSSLERTNSAIDVRHLLPSVEVPTLVLNRESDERAAAGSRYIAERLADARHVEFPGADHVMFAASGDFEPIVSEIERFLAGVWGSGELLIRKPARPRCTHLPRVRAELERRCHLGGHSSTG